MTHEEVYKDIVRRWSHELDDLKRAVAIHEIDKYREEVTSKIASVNELIEYVCRARNIDKKALLGRARKRSLVETRQVIWYLLNKRVVGPRLTFVELGRLFFKDHATALWGASKIEGLLPYDGGLRDEVMMIANNFGVSSNWDPIKKKLTFI
tara:strand:+ start:33 stop:488 length:456 start_codon:yes stop_codon:yes gene_type:complete